MIITRPQGLTLFDWADQLVTDLSQMGYIGRLDDSLQWQTWAAQLLLLSPAFFSLVPDPFQFPSWQDWAERLCSTVN